MQRILHKIAPTGVLASLLWSNKFECTTDQELPDAAA